MLNTASIVRVFLADALERKVLRRDLCTTIRWAKYLPEKRDKVKGLRQRSFDLAQVVTLTTDTRIPEDRRVLYLLRFVAGGLRPSSEANLRWRDLDRSCRPLWRLTVTSAFDSQAKAEKPTTKTGVDYVVPVHPVLQDALEAWQAKGWERFVGRPPTNDDLIVPRQDGTQRRVNVSLEQFYADLAAVGLPRRRQYENRAAFRNLCLRAGASAFHVELITHPKATSAAELHDRIEDQWEGMCAAVLRIDAGPGIARSVLCPHSFTAQVGDQKQKPPVTGRSYRGHRV